MRPFQKILWLGGRLLLGGVFAYAGFLKLTEPVENFRGILAQYEIIPYALTPLLAYVLPWVEFVFGVFLLAGYAPRQSALVLALLSFGFVLVLGLSKLFFSGSLPASCGCFGEGGIQLTTGQIFVLDIVNTVAGLGLFSIKRHPYTLDSWLTQNSKT